MKILFAACIFAISCSHALQNDSDDALSPSLAALDQSLKPAWPTFNELFRVTIGPSDQFQLSGDENNFFFTRSQNLANTIMYLAPGGQKDTVALFPTDYDTQDPAWNKQLGKLAFLSFEKSARGRICIWTMATRETDCFDHPGKVSSPVWGKHGEILFLSRSLPWETGKGDAIFELNITSRLSQSLLRYPHISSFDVHPRTGDIVAVGWNAERSKDDLEKPHFLFAPREDRSPWYSVVLPFKVPFPGFPATPHFDESGENLYFGQFIDDSNQDSKLDGDDKSVVLLFPFAQLRRELDGISQAKLARSRKATLSSSGAAAFEAEIQFKTDSDSEANTEVDDENQAEAKVLPLYETLTFPDQLTASASNCLFPEVIAAQLFVTCAKGIGRTSLDIYAVQKSGVVPADWDEAFLFQAREQARDPSEQVLLTNKLLFRKASRAGGLLPGSATAEMLELLKDLVMLHSSMGEAFAAADVFARWQALRPVNEDSKGRNASSNDAVLENFQDLQKLRRNFQSDNQSFAYREDLARIEKAVAAIEQKKKKGDATDVQQGRILLEFALRVVKRREKWSFEKLQQTGLNFSDVTQKEILLMAGRVLAWALQDHLVSEHDASEILLKWSHQGASRHERIAVSYLVWGLDLLRSQAFRAEASERTFESFERRTQEALAEALSQENARTPGQSAIRDLAITQTRAAALLVLGNRPTSETNDATGDAFRKLTSEIEKLRDPERPYIYRAHAALLASTLAQNSEKMALLMGFHAANWLAKIPLESLEYGIVLENYRKVYLERAYEWWRAQSKEKALDVFYSAVRLTRDEEAHLGLILTSLTSSSSSQALDAKYESLEKALGPSLSGKPIKETIKKLMEYQKERRLRAKNSVSLRGLVAFLDEATELLKERQDSQSVVRDFLKAYIAHEKYRISLEPPRFVDLLLLRSSQTSGDPSALVQAIRLYTVALERVSQRVRLRRLFLNQLGELYLLAGQAALASASFESAFAIPSLQKEENLRLGLLSARAYALSGRPALAAARMQWLIAQLGKTSDAPRVELQAQATTALRQLQAFYLAEARQFEESCSVTRTVLSAHAWALGKELPKAGEFVDSLDVAIKEAASTQKFRSEAALGKWEHAAWACFRSKAQENRILAKDLFKALLASSQSNGAGYTTRKKQRGDFLDFSWLQLKARAAGFLAELESEPHERLSFLQQRIAALEGLIQQDLNIAPDARSLRMALIKTCTQAASLQVDAAARASSIDCSLRELAFLQKKALLFQGRDEFEAIKATALLVFAQINAATDADQSTAVQQQQAHEQFVKFFDSSSSLLAGPQEYVAYGPELALSYLKARLATDFLLGAQKIFKEAAAKRAEGETNPAAPGAEKGTLGAAFLREWKDFCSTNWGARDDNEKLQLLKDKVPELARESAEQRADQKELFDKILPWYSGLLKI